MSFELLPLPPGYRIEKHVNGNWHYAVQDHASATDWPTLELCVAAAWEHHDRTLLRAGLARLGGDVTTQQEASGLTFVGKASNPKVTFYGSQQSEMLRIEADAFLVRGVKVEQGPGEAREVYDAFVAWLAAVQQGGEMMASPDRIWQELNEVDRKIVAARQPEPPASTVSAETWQGPIECENGCPPQTVCDYCQRNLSTVEPVSAGADAPPEGVTDAMLQAAVSAYTDTVMDGPHGDPLRAALDAAYPQLTREIAELRAEVASLVAENRTLRGDCNVLREGNSELSRLAMAKQRALEDAEQQLAASEAALREAREDAERLDFLIAKAEYTDCDGWNFPYLSCWIGPVPRQLTEDARVAIDAARAATKEASSEQQ